MLAIFGLAIHAPRHAPVRMVPLHLAMIAQATGRNFAQAAPPAFVFPTVSAKRHASVHMALRQMVCDNGYDLTANVQCTERQCICRAGLPTTGARCPREGAVRCQCCYQGYRLVASDCEAVPSGEVTPTKQACTIEEDGGSATLGIVLGVFLPLIFCCCCCACIAWRLKNKNCKVGNMSPVVIGLREK